MNPDEAKSYMEEKGYEEYPIDIIEDTDPIISEIKGFRAREGVNMRAVVIGYRGGNRLFKLAIAGAQPEFFRVIDFCRNALLIDEVVLSHDGRIATGEMLGTYEYGALDASNSTEAISFHHITPDRFRTQIIPYRRRTAAVTVS